MRQGVRVWRDTVVVMTSPSYGTTERV